MRSQLGWAVEMSANGDQKVGELAKVEATAPMQCED